MSGPVDDERFDATLRAFLAAEAERTTAAAPPVGETLTRLRETAGPPSRRALAPAWLLLVLALLLTAALATSLALSSGLIKLSVLVTPSPTATASPPPSASIAATLAPSPTPTPGLVAYTAISQLQPGEGTCIAPNPSFPNPPGICTTTHAWVARADGSDAHALFANDQQGQEVLGWSADGSELIVEEDNDLVVANVAGSELARFPIWDTCKGSSCSGTPRVLCPHPCAGAAGFALSPDGTRVVFARAYPDVDNATVIAVLDLGSGNVKELASTRTTNPPVTAPCWKLSTCEGLDSSPRWSPDGTRIVFARQVMSPEPGVSWTSAALFVVDPDGSNLHRVTPVGVVAIDPEWSPTGDRLVFTKSEYVVNADRTSVLAIHADISIIGLDGSALTRLTEDGTSARAGWTVDGRLVFMRPISGDAADGYEDWIMGVDGSSQTQLGGSLAELSAAGCRTCIYPLVTSTSGTVYRAYWQPAG